MTKAVLLEWCGLMKDYQELAKEYGTPIVFRIRTEAQVTRDGYDTIKRKTLVGSRDIETYALPVDRGPDVRKLQALGIREDCDIAVTVPLADWAEIIKAETIGPDFAGLDLNRMTVELDGQQFKVADKGIPVRYGARSVALSFGLRRN